LAAISFSSSFGKFAKFEGLEEAIVDIDNCLVFVGDEEIELI
jgi:hypothetical protein